VNLHWDLSYKFWISTPILKLKMTIISILNCELDEAILNLIQWSKRSLELEVPTIGPHKLTHFQACEDYPFETYL